MLLFWLRPAFIYGEAGLGNALTPTASLAIVLWVSHFVKREVRGVSAPCRWYYFLATSRDDYHASTHALHVQRCAV
jgi:hypothetical protein